MAPTSESVHNLFSQLAKQETQKNFFDSVADNVNWWLVGHTQMSGTYNSKQAFLDATIEVLNKKVLGGPLLMRITNVAVGGDYATVELEAIDAKCKNGMTYDMRYCWVVRFGKESGLIEEVRAYIDTDLLSRAIEENQ